MKIIPVDERNLSQTIDLLKSSALPVEDLSARVHLFVLENSNKISGAIGIEFDRETGLLRSLAVAPDLRGEGYGKKLVSFIESFAKDHGIKELYLLTTTAQQFFSGLGYHTTERNSVAAFIRETSEFKNVCPSSAIVMKKKL